jgi:hypothetical protein
MALSIDWLTRVITVPKADMALVQSSPFEIRELDIDVFRLELHDIQDGDGMPFPDIFRHIAPISIGGVTLARVVEIINGYSITFENGTYAVNVTGGNSNVSDRTNLNSVQVRSANSAGLVQIVSGSGLSVEQDQRLTDIESRVNTLPDADAIADAVWNAQVIDYITTGTMGDELTSAIAMVADVYTISGLDETAPMTVTPTTRTAGTISLDITGDGVTSTTVTRQ